MSLNCCFVYLEGFSEFVYHVHVQKCMLIPHFVGSWMARSELAYVAVHEQCLISSSRRWQGLFMYIMHVHVHCIYVYTVPRACIQWCNAQLSDIKILTVCDMFLCLQVGAAFRPNLGQCALSPNTENGATFDEYTEDTIYVSIFCTFHM